MNADLSMMLALHRNTLGHARNDGSSIRLCGTTTAPETRSLTSSTSSRCSTPTPIPLVSPPRVHRRVFSADSPLASPLNLFNALQKDIANGLPSLPFGRTNSSPHLGAERDQLEPDEQFCDQRVRSKQLVTKWRECQRNMNKDGKDAIDCPITNIEYLDAHTQHRDRSSKKKKHNSSNEEMEYEMTIRSSSLEGTTEAAAWHLHGQSGGRTNASTTKHSQYGNSVSVMNSKAMSRMRKAEKALLREETCETSHSEVDDYETNVLVDLLEKGGDTLITSNAKLLLQNGEENGDAWSTGVASAVVMGTAARYQKVICMFPHGRRVLLPIIMGIMALALSIYTSSACRFMSIHPTSASLRDVFQVGPWFYLSNDPQSQEVCMPYPSETSLDAWFMVARASCALALCLGVGLLLWTCTLTCIPYSRSFLNWIGVGYFAAAIMQMTTTFFYLSTNCGGGVDDAGNDIGGGYFMGVHCSANQDLVICIAASAMYFATGWVMYIAQGVIATDPGLSSSEVYTWSAVSKSSDLEKGVLRTVEKSWTKIPDGSVLMATVVVERTRDKRGRIKTTHSIRTEVLPAP